VMTGDVSSTEDQVWVTASDGAVTKSIWQLNYGSETKNVGSAIGIKNGEAPLNFAESMYTPGQMEFALSTCLANATITCIFTEESKNSRRASYV